MTVEDTLIGEAWRLDGTDRLTLRSSVCDRTGGYIRAQDRAQITIEDSTITCLIVVIDEARVTLRDSRIEADINIDAHATLQIRNSQIVGDLNVGPEAQVVREQK